MGGVFLHAPEPSQNIHGENGNASAGSDASQCLLRAWLPVRKAVAANDDSDQTRDLGDGSREEGLNGREAGVEGGSAPLSVGGEGKKEDCQWEEKPNVGSIRILLVAA